SRGPRWSAWLAARGPGEGAGSQTLAVGQPLSAGPRGAGRRWGLGVRLGLRPFPGPRPGQAGGGARPSSGRPSCPLSPNSAPEQRRARGSPRAAREEGGCSPAAEVGWERGECLERRQSQRRGFEQSGKARRKLFKAQASEAQEDYVPLLQEPPGAASRCSLNHFNLPSLEQRPLPLGGDTHVSPPASEERTVGPALKELTDSTRLEEIGKGH
ncbi:hypothetical protein MC885_010053, partial [Smutsia gigantea]